MAYPDGTPTGDDHAEKARKLLEPMTNEGDSLDTAQLVMLDALRGIGHALLAIHAEHQTRRAEGSGW